MTKKLKPKHLDPLKLQLDDQHSILVAMRRELERQPLSPELARVETLLTGVKMGLERMGGNVLPGFVADVHALRDQMVELRQEMAGYRALLMRLTNWFDRYDATTRHDDQYRSEPKSKPGQRRRRRTAQSDLPLVSNGDAETSDPQPATQDGKNEG
jgi:hypothetical protein